MSEWGTDSQRRGGNQGRGNTLAIRAIKRNPSFLSIGDQAQTLVTRNAMSRWSDEQKAILAKLDAWKADPPYRLSWAAGQQSLPFKEASSALLYAETLRVVYGVRDAVIDAKDGPEFLSCDCGCGRLFTDGEGCRIGRSLLHEFCYDRHPVVYVERALEMASRVETE